MSNITGRYSEAAKEPGQPCYSIPWHPASRHCPGRRFETLRDDGKIFFLRQRSVMIGSRGEFRR